MMIRLTAIAIAVHGRAVAVDPVLGVAAGLHGCRVRQWPRAALAFQQSHDDAATV